LKRLSKDIGYTLELISADIDYHYKEYVLDVIRDNTKIQEDKNSDLLEEFWDTHESYLEIYFERGGCGIAAKDLSDFLYGKKINNEIIKTGFIDREGAKQLGWFEIDNPEYTYDSLTKADIQKMKESNMDPRKSSDIESYAKENDLVDDFKLIPHSWVEVNGVILDPSGFYRDGKSGQFDNLLNNKQILANRYKYFKNNIAL
jgi:hypothetical protein